MNDRFIGKTLGHYEIIAQLGHGGMADVYRARQTTMNREVAMKVLSNTLTRDQKFIDRFTREVQTIARLEHSNIVPVYEHANTPDGITYLTMRYLKGGTLADLIKERGALPLALVDSLLQQIASALDYAHQNGVIHRDIKPSNVLLDEQQNAYLADFGLARTGEKDFAQTLTEAGVMIGTPTYIAPELIQEDVADKRSDLYSLGVVLYEMVTGRPPFTGDSVFAIMQAHLNRQPPRPSTLRVDLSAGVERVLLKAIHKNPTHRYQSALEMADDLRRAVQSHVPTLPGAANMQTILVRTGAFARSRPRLFGLGVLLAVLLVFGLFTLPRLNQANDTETPSAQPTLAANDSTPTTLFTPTPMPYADEADRPDVGRVESLQNTPDEVRLAIERLRGSFIGIMPCSLKTDYHSSLASAARTRANELGINAEVEDSEENQFRQPAIIRSFIARGARAIIICPLNYDSIEPAVRAAQAAGIVTVIIGDTAFGKYSTSFNLTNEDMGRIAAEYTANLINTELGGKAQVAILDYPTVSDVVKRANAMEETLRELAPDAEILGRWTGGTIQEGEASMREILTKHPDVNVILSINDAGALGTIGVLEKAGKQPNDVHIVSVDAESEVRRLMIAGKYFRASLDSDPLGVGRLSVDAIVSIVSGKVVPRKIGLEGVMITREMLQATPAP
jgi:serine/threonine protein kinase/ABC-type sugar transport system substrate-binding protein